MEIKDMVPGTVLYLHKNDSPSGQGRVSVLLGVPVEDGGQLCYAVEGHRHVAAYGPDTSFYSLTQERLDSGVEGVPLNEGPEATLWRKGLLDSAQHGLESKSFGMEDLSELRDADWTRVGEAIRELGEAA